MHYNNLTEASVKRIHDSIQQDYIRSNNASFFEKNCLSRGMYILMIPASFAVCVLDTIAGVGATLGALCTLGKNQWFVKHSENYLQSSKKILALPFKNFLRVIDPSDTLSKEAYINVKGNGFIQEEVFDTLNNYGLKFSNSKNIFTRHVASRLTYLVLAITSVVTRVLDGVISIPATVISILVLGKVDSIKHLAFRTLQATGLVNDILFCAIKIVNPWARTRDH